MQMLCLNVTCNSFLIVYLMTKYNFCFIYNLWVILFLTQILFYIIHFQWKVPQPNILLIIMIGLQKGNRFQWSCQDVHSHLLSTIFVLEISCDKGFLYLVQHDTDWPVPDIFSLGLVSTNKSVSSRGFFSFVTNVYMCNFLVYHPRDTDMSEAIEDSILNIYKAC